MKSNHGGKRDGAGNKAKVPGKPNQNHVGTRISDELLAEMDTLRATRKRSDWVREAIVEKVEREGKGRDGNL